MSFERWGRPVEPPAIYEVLLEHERRRWDAAEENARRQAQRLTLLLTSVFAFLAVGLFRVGLDMLGRSIDVPLWAALAIRVLVVLGLALTLWGSLFFVGLRGELRPDELPPERERRKLASRELDLSIHPLQEWFRIPPEEPPPRESIEYYRFRVYCCVREAATLLEVQNAAERYRIDKGQLWFWRGLRLFFLAIALYTVIPREPAGRGALPGERKPPALAPTSPLGGIHGITPAKQPTAPGGGSGRAIPFSPRVGSKPPLGGIRPNP
jgi:hypothetical protein